MHITYDYYMHVYTAHVCLCLSKDPATTYFLAFGSTTSHL